MKYLALSFLAGLVGALGFQPLGLWPLTILAFVALLWLVEQAPGLRSALARGWWFGVGQFVLGLNWIATAFTYQAAMPAWLGWVAVGLLSLYLAIYPAAAAGLAWRWGRANPLAFSLIFAAAWIVTEWLRATVFTGFAWNPIGVVLVDRSIAPFAALLGTYSLSAMVVLFAGLIRIGVVGPDRRAAFPLALFAVVAQIAASFALSDPPAGEGVPVRIVQPNISQSQKHSEDAGMIAAQRLNQLSLPLGSEPRLLFWPEDAVPAILDEQPEARRAIAGLLGPRDLLLTGGVKVERDGSGRVIGARNSVYIMDASERLLSRYDKAHLVPYGEYLPMRPLLSALGISRLVPGDVEFWEGPGPRTFELPGIGTVGFQVCYEIIFSGRVVDRAHRPAFLFNPSNDAWFGAWGPPQHLAQARLRALEEGLPVVRATPTGISAIVDAHGRLLHSIPLGQMGVIDARLPLAAPPTLFARYGNLLPFAFALLLVAAAIAVGRKAR